jgi:hypothetical protein
MSVSDQLAAISRAESALRNAVERNDVGSIRVALASGAAPGTKTLGMDRLATVLHEAAGRGYREAARALVDAGASVREKSSAGMTPLDDAINFSPDRDKEAFCIWFAELTGPAARESNFPIAAAARLGFVALIDTLVSLGCPFDQRGSGLRCALGSAAFAGSAPGVAKMIELGVDLDTIDESGQTPLHYAAAGGYVGVARQLLDAGANPNIKHNSGYSPLHVACTRDVEDIASALLSAGADPDLKNDYGKDAWEWSLGCGAVGVMSALEKAGVGKSMEQTELDKRLGFAVKHGHARMVQRLLGRGADPTARIDGRTLIQLAQKGADEIKGLILAARAGELIGGAIGAELPANTSAVKHSMPIL